MLNRSACAVMSTSVLKALPGKLDIKRHSPGILYIKWFYLEAMMKCNFVFQSDMISWAKAKTSMCCRVKSGIFGQTAKFGQRPCLFHISNIRIISFLTNQKVKILMRRLIRSRLIWIYTVCKCVSDFTWCPNLPDFTLYCDCYILYIKLLKIVHLVAWIILPW